MTTQSTDAQTLFRALLCAEDEEEALSVLRAANYSPEDDTIWTPLGDNAGNFSVVGNQADNAAAAFVEKLVNSIDAVLLGECHRHGIDPESSEAPRSMQEAVQQFFGARDGRLDTLTTLQQKQLAERIHVIATGHRGTPSYCIVDRGEGQTPNRFPDTFLSTSRSSPKIRIDFVQGKFNAGGSGSLQFCGQHNLQLIASRRQPFAHPADDESADLWGFTVVRRRRPRHGERSSTFVYLAPGNSVLRFRADAINALPGKSGKNSPPPAYDGALDYGTVVKLYNYKWSAHGIATLETRRQLERVLHTPFLPFRVTETRNYHANYYATTVIGVWNTLSANDVGPDPSAKMEPGFPATSNITVPGLGRLPIRIGVWRSEVKPRHQPTGVFFLNNGQVHGQYPPDFVTRRLKFDYIRNHILVSVDCTDIDRGAAEDLFMASRDRLRKNEHYELIRDRLSEELGSHPGLKALNAARRKQRIEGASDSSAPIEEMISSLIQADPGLANLFGFGQTLLTSVGPGFGQPFQGRQFPTFFRLAKQPKSGVLKKSCPVNRTVTVEFETDAENQYFHRPTDAGEIRIKPDVGLLEASRLWNGTFAARFRVPWDAKPGDVTRVRLLVSDIECVARGPFISEFDLVATPEVDVRRKSPSPNGDGETDGKPNRQGSKNQPSLALPKINHVRKPEWGPEVGIQSPYDAFRVRSNPDGGYDFFVNQDCAWLLTELANKKNDAGQIQHWFTWGLALVALGMLRQHKEQEKDAQPNLDTVGDACDGVARVIIPMFRVLYPGPPSSP